MAGLPPQLHDSAGARRDAGSDLPRNYGDPAAEYEAARSGAVVVDRADRAFVRVYGRDPVRMVQGLVSNDVAGAAPDRAIYAAVLTPKGRMIADVRIVRYGEELLLDCDAAAREPLLGHLRKFVPPLYARFEDVTGAWSQLSLYGPGAAAAARAALDVAAPEAEDALTVAAYADASLLLIGSAYAGAGGVDIVTPAALAPELWRRLVAAGARPLGHATLDVLRIEAGQPRWGAELTDETIPLEAGLRERAISETKGCYTGQEVIIRILHRGHVNWQLRGVLLADAAAPHRGTALLDAAGERRLGRITSAAWSPRHGQTIALAYVRREVEPPAELRLAADASPGAPAQVVALPFDAR